MGELTTHVLDTAQGCAAAGMPIDLFRVAADGTTSLIKTVETNDRGRTDAPLLTGRDFVVGQYQLRFHVAFYFASAGVPTGDPPFLDRVPIAFAVAEAEAHYHIPLLVSPWSYTTYRGG